MSTLCQLYVNFNICKIFKCPADLSVGGVPYDVICGTFVVVGLEADHCCSLTEEQLTRYHALYSREMLLPCPKQPERGGKTHEAR